MSQNPPTPADCLQPEKPWASQFLELMACEILVEASCATHRLWTLPIGGLRVKTQAEALRMMSKQSEIVLQRFGVKKTKAGYLIPARSYRHFIEPGEDLQPVPLLEALAWVRNSCKRREKHSDNLQGAWFE